MIHFQSIIRFTGILVFFLGLSIGAPVLVSIVYRDGTTLALLYSMALSMGAGLLFFRLGKIADDAVISHRDGVAIVTFGWIIAGFIGALPFLLSGFIPHFTDAYFESVSGFTTTGASILTNIEALPRGLLLWRSLIQWFGGMGIIVFSIAILPFLGVGGMQLYKAEIPSPVMDKLKPRISDTAKALWKVYLLITILQILLLVLGGMPVFEAACHAFCTMPTGGFSPRNASIAYYNDPYFEGVIIFFMLLAGINFSLHYKLLRGDLQVFYRDPECRTFLIIVAAFTVIIAMDIYGSVYQSLVTAFRYAAFQVSSIITTTGFATADFDTWPALSKTILVLSMFLGAMAGSTGGGLKIMRIILLAKQSYKEVFHIIHPHAVTAVKLGGKPVPQEILSSIWGFFVLYLGIYVASVLIMAALGLDMVSALSAVAACIFNIGPGLGTVGPVQNYASIPFLGKWLLTFCMLVGRLEIYTVIVLLMPEFWRK
jgi:trk system potassium uptake protein TrkH